jgi:NADH-quinone oxidoreductase subunit L
MLKLETLCSIVVILPLVAALLVGLFNQQLPRRMAHWLTLMAVGCSFFISSYILKTLMGDTVSSINSTWYTWGQSFDLSFQIGFLVDRLSALMMVIVTFVSLMVHIYTMGYMQEDPGYRRFFCYISLFTFAMLMLVMANNFLQLFFGWEAVGLMSYLLIGFWFQKEAANQASLKAFLINRVSDLGFLIGIAAVLFYFGSLDYQTVFANVEQVAIGQVNLFASSGVEVSAFTVICLCLLIGAMGKSAQIPLHVWLPDSMEGPTPISALIHAATMVTAGIFMVARLSPLFEHSETILNVILVIGALTSVLTGLLAVVQSDIKKIIAYSTLSQLGYMMVAMGTSAYGVGIFHLMTHAFFKALLFLGAGSVIIALHHEQNIWKMGGLRRYLPITYSTLLIGSLALIGFPFFSGFYSKDLIIEAVGLSKLPFAPIAYSMVLISVFITALYTFRLLFVVFHTEERFDIHQKEHLHESAWVILLPLIFLAVPSIISGFVFIKPLMQGFFEGSIQIQPNHLVFSELQHNFEGVIPMGMHGFTYWPFWLGLAGVFTAWACYIQFPSIPITLQKRFSCIASILNEKYGFDAFYEWIVARGIRAIGFLFWRLGDQWMIDGIAVNGSAKVVDRLSIVGSHIQTGYLYHYVFVMITGFLFLLVWLMLS